VFRPNTILRVIERDRADYVIGEPGTGKSRYLDSLIKQDIEAGRGVSMVDVAGGLYQRLEAWLAQRPQYWSRLVLINLQDTKYIVRVNPLAVIEGMETHQISEFFRSMMVELWDVDVDDAPRMSWMMAHAFQGLAASDLSLVDLEDFLTNKAFRDDQLQKLPPHMSHIRRYFATQFGKAQGGVYPFILPTLSRTGPLLFYPDLRLMFAGKESLDFRRVLDDELIVLVNAPKGFLAPEPSKLVAAFITARFQQAAIARANTHIDDLSARKQHFLYLDEFGNYTTSNILNILSELRQFRLSVVAAHQYLMQLSPEFQAGILSTAGVISCMRVGIQDAKVLAPFVFPREDFFEKREVKYRTVGSGLAQTVMAEWQRKPFGYDALAQVLANQNNRSVWVRRKGPFDPIHLQTHDMPDMNLSSQNREQVAQMREACGKRWGVYREDAQRELDALERQRAEMRAAAKAKEADKPKRKRGRPKKNVTEVKK
jgi:hypothetical protein